MYLCLEAEVLVRTSLLASYHFVTIHGFLQLPGVGQRDFRYAHLPSLFGGISTCYKALSYSWGSAENPVATCRRSKRREDACFGLEFSVLISEAFIR